MSAIVACLGGAVILVAVSLSGCAPSGGPASPSGSRPASAAPTVGPRTLGPSVPGRDDVRFLLTCRIPDGSEAATFSRLEEAWAWPDYVRIESCEAAVAEPGDFQLTDTEQAIAEIAAADLADADATAAYLRTLAACVRLSPEGIASEPTSVLEATVVRCPEAPQAGLIEQELSVRAGM